MRKVVQCFFTVLLAVVNLLLSASCDEPVPAPEVIAVTEVSLSETSVALTIGSHITLTATVFPDNATDKNIIWSSSNNNVATVSDGKITAVSVGKATVTAYAGNVQAECIVTVSPIEVTSISLDKSAVTLVSGNSVALTATVQPGNATDRTVTWSSSDSGVATVSDGNVTALSVGKATITAQAGNAKAECIVTVNPIVATSITINKSAVTLLPGESVALTATVQPGNATDRTVTWSSSDSGVATVSDGNVTALSVGKATITAQAGNVKDECIVTVNPIEATSVTLDKSEVILAPGESVALIATVYPDNASDKTVTWSSSDPDIVTVSDGNVTALAYGKATVTAQTVNGICVTCKVDVIKRPASGGSEGTGETEW